MKALSRDKIPARGRMEDGGMEDRAMQEGPAGPAAARDRSPPVSNGHESFGPGATKAFLKKNSGITYDRAA